MKRLFISLLVFMLTLTFIGCDSEEINAVSSESSIVSESESAEGSKEESMEESMEESVDPTLNATKKITTLDYVNKGKMGDVDGPAFCVYSKKGFNGASVVLDIANSEIQTKLPDGKHVNGYIFLGADVFEGAYWINCFDAGLCWSGRSGGWHIFYNIYETVNESTSSWYESTKKLPKNGRYRMTLELIEDELAKLTVEGLDNKFKDSVKIEIKGAKKTGINTGMLFNVALDYPPDTKVDQNGEPTEDWGQITLAHSDKGIYLKNLHATELTLFKNGVAQTWLSKQNSSVGIWPDKQIEGFDYAPTEVFLYDGSEYYINLDMNRK
jgi:hypothetical protein